MNRNSHSIRRIERNAEEVGDGVQELRDARTKLKEIVRQGLPPEKFEEAYLEILGWGLVAGISMTEEIQCGREIQKLLEGKRERVKEKNTISTAQEMSSRFKVS